MPMLGLALATAAVLLSSPELMPMLELALATAALLLSSPELIPMLDLALATAALLLSFPEFMPMLDLALATAALLLSSPELMPMLGLALATAALLLSSPILIPMLDLVLATGGGGLVGDLSTCPNLFERPATRERLLLLSTVPTAEVVELLVEHAWLFTPLVESVDAESLPESDLALDSPGPVTASDCWNAFLILETDCEDVSGGGLDVAESSPSVDMAESLSVFVPSIFRAPALRGILVEVKDGCTSGANVLTDETEPLEITRLDAAGDTKPEPVHGTDTQTQTQTHTQTHTHRHTDTHTTMGRRFSLGGQCVEDVPDE